MRVLLVKPQCEPMWCIIAHTLHDMQQLVGGDIEIFDAMGDDAVIVLNENGKNEGLPFNRSVCSEPIVGPFFVCSRNQDGGLCDLNENGKMLAEQGLSIAHI